jgi:hypothetical protein
MDPAMSGSVITQFNLQRLPAFDWVQRQQRIDALEACAASNSTSTCDVGSAVPVASKKEGKMLKFFSIN